MATSSNTSKLLINEPPLQVLPSLAVKVGLNGAIFLQQVHYWINQPKAHERDGRFWVYNSLPEWQEQFPFWSEDTIQRTIAGLEKQGVLLSGNYNAAKFDRTKWYTIDYDALDALEVTPPPRKSRRPSRESASASPQLAVTTTAKSGEHRRTLRGPIPETNAETTTEREIAPAPAMRDISHEAPSRPIPILAVPLPDDYPLTDEMQAWARTNVPSLNGSLVMEHNKFCAYYRSIAHDKKLGRRANWRPVWELWMTRQAGGEFGRKGHTSSPAPGPEPRYITARSS